MINTFRHDYTLVWGNNMKHIIAPRYFDLGGYRYFIHLSENCERVYIFIQLRYINNTCIMVAVGNALKLYSNKKGLYFNYSYWINNYEKKSSRIYICE